MKQTPSERRLAENEVVFRNANQSVVETLDAIRTGEETQKVSNPASKDLQLLFFCECADDKCTQRIKLPASEYKEIHSQSNEFVIVPGHEVAKIEKVTYKAPNYFIVQKYMTPPQKAAKLHSKEKNM